MTPLMTASAIGFSPGVEELLKNGAEINYEVIATVLFICIIRISIVNYCSPLARWSCSHVIRIK